jgi:membrane protease subunit (stomatin/prohibitin family)
VNPLALIDVIKCEKMPDRALAWKFPSKNLSLGSQLIVNEGLSAVFVKGGKALDVFHSGTYTLSSQNLPLLDKLINLPFGGETPFTAEVWFFSTVDRRDFPWGTTTPIQIFDPSISIPLSVRAYGLWGGRVVDPVLLLSKIMGVQSSLGSESISTYIGGELLREVGDLISEKILGGLPVLQANSQLNELSDELFGILTSSLVEIGISITVFNIQNINIPQREMAKVQDIYASAFEAEQLSKANVNSNYTTVKGLEVMSDAANNTADNGAGGLMAGALGIGAALPLGSGLGATIADDMKRSNKGDTALEQLRGLKNMLDEGLIDKDIYAAKRDEILAKL